MTLAEWIKSASYEDLRKFIWMVYHCGNVDGRNHCEDSPSGSFFGERIFKYQIHDVMNILKNYEEE